MPLEHLPERWQPRAYRVRDFLMTDATAQIVMGIVILLRGMSYAPVILGPPPLHGSHPAENILPLNVWAAIWIGVGVVCVAAPFTRRARLEAASIGAGVFLHMLWGFSFLSLTLLGEAERSWVTSLGYFATAFLVAWAVWRGKRGDYPAYPGEGVRGR